MADGSTETSSAGSVHGFAVTASQPFVYLRTGGGEPLTILENDAPPADPGTCLADMQARNALATRVYERDGRLSLQVEGIGWFRIDPSAGIITRPGHSDGAWLESTLWGLPVALLVLSRGGFFFHAAAVEIDGRAVVLTGPSHHGKTTLAGALAAAGHRLLAEDLLRCDVGHPCLVYPGPAMLRLRRDVADWLVVPGAERVAEDDEKVHLALAPEGRGTGDPLPLAGIVFLHADAHATASIERVEPAAAMRDLWAVSLNLPTAAGRAQCFSDIAEIVDTVPLWKMTRPLTRDALASSIAMVVDAGRAR